MQRPRSEGRRPASHSQCRPSRVSRSLQFSTGDHRDGSQYSDLSNPRRPNTTPKPRIQRLLPTPGQNVERDWHSSQQLIVQSPSILIQLPNSPPQLRSVSSIKQFAPVREANVVAFDVNDEQSTPRLASLEKAVPSSIPATTIFHFQSTLAPSDTSSPSLELLNGSDSNDAREGTSVPNSTTVSLESEGDEEGQGQPPEENRSIDDVHGPILADIRGDNLVAENLRNQDENHGLQNSANDDIDEDGEYRELLADRARLLDDEANRQRIREELETYVDSLGSRRDEDGEHLVQFPRNYRQIVSLMTQKDVREENEKAQDGKATRQSWSRVLIESGLSKQQAFGILEDGDDDPDGNGGLAAKIALKMAHIRQLDTILEEKLGKNLYSSIVPRKQKRAKTPSLPTTTQDINSRTSTASSASRTFVTQAKSIAIASSGNNTSRSSASSSQSSSSDVTQEWTIANCAKRSNNFVERNKQVVANGMKANMTKDEEDRLEKLLSDEVIPPAGSKTSEDSTAGKSNNAETGAVFQECNEFTMADSEKEAIDELIASKSCSHPLFAIDEQDNPTDDAFLTPGDSSQSAKSNVIQQTKTERLQRQRLSRVEQELRFLQEAPSVVIVGDDHDDGDNDDCRSEISYATVASSTCSTRSGVISRHDFRCFLAQQKESFRSTPTASADEIRRLLLSMGHGTSLSSSTVTATTG